MAKQTWNVGDTVRVGFVAGLIVAEKVASPRNYRPDGYVLTRGDAIYAFVPHDGGLRRVRDADEARAEIRG